MEEININLGAWSSVFAVPSEIVDKYIKLAGAAQLKVLLWILKNAGTPFKVEDIGNALSMHTADVRDCIEFWVTAGLLCKNDNCLVPKEESTAQVPLQMTQTAKEINNQHTAQKESQTEVAKEAAVPVEEPPIKPAPPKRAPARTQQPDSIFVAQRINGDENLANLMQEAQVILGRPLSHGDSATLLMMHDTDGLPVDVILMILQYAVGEGKGMRYIEKMGINWASEGIDTHEKAEEKIWEISKTKDAWHKVAQTFGINNPGTPTDAQLEYANRWINLWGYSLEMLRIAYETCVDTKGEYNLRYINGIIKKWHTSGILTEKELEASKTAAKKGAAKTKAKTSYDIEAYESYSIFDNEEQ